MKQAKGADLYTINEMTEFLNVFIFELMEDERHDMYITDEAGDIQTYLALERKTIINHDVIIFGNEECFDHLKMFSMDDTENNFVTVNDIRQVLNSIGRLDRENYFTFDDLQD